MDLDKFINRIMGCLNLQKQQSGLSDPGGTFQSCVLSDIHEKAQISTRYHSCNAEESALI